MNYSSPCRRFHASYVLRGRILGTRLTRVLVRRGNMDILFLLMLGNKKKEAVTAKSKTAEVSSNARGSISSYCMVRPCGWCAAKVVLKKEKKPPTSGHLCPIFTPPLVAPDVVLRICMVAYLTCQLLLHGSNPELSFL